MENVALVKCDTYDKQEVERALEACIDHLGGISEYIKPGMKVLLKCNLLMKKHPDAAVTTHPAIVEALVKAIQKLGAYPIIADSPGGPFTHFALKGVYKLCGMLDIAERTGAELSYDISSKKVHHPEGKIIKSLDIIGILDQVDAVISVAKLKTHGMTLYTGAVKNLFGVIPGTSKAEYHFRMSELKDFTDVLVDICTFVKPTLSIIDAVYGMEGDGPSGGSPRKIGAILASTDAFALDVAACSLVGLPIGRVPTIQRAKERGLASTMSEVKLIGDEIDSIKDFKLPKTYSSNFLEKWLPSNNKFTKFLNARIGPRPYFNHKSCVGCSDCAANCPPEAIVMKDKKPYVDLNKCIKCYCCQELCPIKAVHIKRNMLFKIIR